MTLISYSISLSEQLQNSYIQLWLSLKQEFQDFNPTTSLTRETHLLDRLRSIKNSLVGTKARKLFTTTEPKISNELVILARILEWESLELNIIHLKVEASAIVGLLAIPEDQPVSVLLDTGFPAIIIDSIPRFLRKIPVQSLLSCRSRTSQAEHHLLQTLLRTLSSLYSAIQDVSSHRKWGFMTKSPERVHQRQPPNLTKTKIDHFSSPTTVNSFQAQSSSPKIDRKGKTKASNGLNENIFMIRPSSTHEIDGETTVDFAQDSWPSSKPDKFKQACEHAKTLLSNFIVYSITLMPLISALSLPSKCFPSEELAINLSLTSIADIIVPCFQLIWLTCKDTRRQLWLLRKLIEEVDVYGLEENCLKSLIKCLAIWLRSNHDLAIEFSIRTIGVLLSINEPPHYSEDDELQYLDDFVWSQASPSASHESNGIGWILACKAQEGLNPILRSALITSIIGLVKHAPDIREEMLQIQISHSIALMDNASYPITVRCEASYALAHALTVSETLQYTAYEANAIPVLKKLIDKAFEDPFPYSTPAADTQNAMLKESAYLALAAIMSTLEAPRQDVAELNLIKSFVDSMSDESILVRAASCQCCRALSRGTSNLRNELIDQGVGNHLFDLALGTKDQSHQDTFSDQGIERLRDNPTDFHNFDDDHDEDAVEIQLKIIAMGTICNLLLDFLPMKNEMLKRNGVAKFVQLLKFSNHQSSKETALWGLKSIVFLSPFQLKLSVVMKIGWDYIRKCLQDKNLSIQANMASFLRNLVCGETSDIDLLFKQLIASNNPSDVNHDPPLIDLLEDKLSLVTSSSDFVIACATATSNKGKQNDITRTNYPASSSRTIENSSRENILVQTLFLFSNIATGTSSHKGFILHRPKIMKAILKSLSHPNSEIQRGSIWCLINLSHFDEDTKPNVVKNTIEKLEEFGLITKLKQKINDDKSLNPSPFKNGNHAHFTGLGSDSGAFDINSDSLKVQGIARCALEQILKLKEKYLC